MTVKLHTILALLKGVRARTHNADSELHKLAQKSQLYQGITRRYEPKDAEGDQLPPESTLVQIRAGDVLDQFSENMTQLWDMTGTMERTTGASYADLVLPDGTTLATDLPGTFLLFLERQFDDVRTFVAKIPTLDPSEKWAYDAAADAWATDTITSMRTKKVMKNHRVAAATDRHAEQVQVYTEDEIVGKWMTIKYSGALPAARQRELLERIDVLRDAVKAARQRANDAEAIDVEVGERLFAFLLSGS